jgi:hypothetical protein
VDPGLILFLVTGLSILVFLAFAIFMFTRVTITPAVLENEALPAAAERPDREPDREPDRRPWWARPPSWLLIAAVFLFIGLFVTPKIFGGVFLFFPFFWIGRPRRRGPRSSHEGPA